MSERREWQRQRRAQGLLHRLGLLWHTVRFLRPVQVYGRIWFRIHRPSVDTSVPPPLRPVDGRWIRPAAHHATMLGPDEFRLLNEAGSLADHGWDDPALPKLWRYNLHYFDDLLAADASSRTDWHGDLARRWVAENPPAEGTGWEPYPTSLRMVNWIKWTLGGAPLPEECIASLAVQARWLARRLERHLLGNHLFVNAKALLFAGAFFDGKEADGWLETGLSLLASEIPEQILGDGGQFELSPMYHALGFEDVLDLINLRGAYPSALAGRHPVSGESLSGRAGDMRRWLAVMTHPDGEISFFNDAAMGIAPAPVELHAYADRLGVGGSAEVPLGLTHLADSGYFRVSRGDAVSLIDVARIGPAYLTGHSHADTLSFELSLFGSRVLVNSGTSEYGTGPERRRQRGTAAHNTVVVNGENSSEVWSGFRTARRAAVHDVTYTGEWPIQLSASHDGYSRLAGSPVHRRAWTFDGDGMVVEDTLTGSFDAAEARFHFHPDVVAVADEEMGKRVMLRLPNGVSAALVAEHGELRVEAATWHPEFGRTVPSACAVVRLVGGRAVTRVGWGPPG